MTDEVPDDLSGLQEPVLAMEGAAMFNSLLGAAMGVPTSTLQGGPFDGAEVYPNWLHRQHLTMKKKSWDGSFPLWPDTVLSISACYDYSLDDQGRVIAAVYRPDSEKHLTLGDMLMEGVAVMETRVKLTRDLLETAATGLYEDAIGAYWQAWLRIPYTVRLSRATLGIIRFNIAFSIALKGIFLALGVVGAATLWMAVVADMGASLVVIVNGLRLLRRA